MNRRTATVVVCVVDAVACASIALATFLSGSDPATIGLDQAAGIVVIGLFLVTGAPAIVLVRLRRAPMAALVLALAFPALLIALLVVAVVAFA